MQHTSISAPSICTLKYAQAYLVNGTLPAEGTVCPVLGPPLPALNTNEFLVTRDKASDLVEDRVVIDAMMDLSKRWHKLGLL